MDPIEAAIARLVTVAVTTAVQVLVTELLERIDVIAAAWRRAMTPTMSEAPTADPAAAAALEKQRANAIASGTLPPAYLR